MSIFEEYDMRRQWQNLSLLDKIISLDLAW